MPQFEVLKPECYSRFNCKGGTCRFSCCSSWSIYMSSDEYKCLRKKNGSYGNQIAQLPVARRGLHRDYEMTLNPEGHCPFLTDEKLCQLQVTHGADILPVTCQEFPRSYHYYLNKSEMGLSLGCEKTIELLLEEKNGLIFENHVEHIPRNWKFNSFTDEKKRLKNPAHTYYYDVQSLCLGILQAEDASMEDRLIILGMALSHIDQLVESGNKVEIPAYIHVFLNEVDAIDAMSQLVSVKGEHLGALLSNLNTIQRFQDSKSSLSIQLARKIEKRLGLEVSFHNAEDPASYRKDLNFSADIYHQCQDEFRVLMEGKEYFIENIVVAFMIFFNMPFHNPNNGVWKDYTYFMWVYAMLKFTMTAALTKDSTTEDIVDCCVILFRMLCHNDALYEEIIKQLEDNQSNTLAHMAIFLKTC